MLKKQLTYSEVLLLKTAARTALTTTSMPCILSGMGQDLTDGDVLAISYLQATLSLLNHRGLLVPDWQEKFEIMFLHQDSEPETEYDADDDDEEPPKSKP